MAAALNFAKLGMMAMGAGSVPLTVIIAFPPPQDMGWGLAVVLMVWFALIGACAGYGIWAMGPER